MNKSLYRKELDGVRALAIIPVILFHLGFSVFSGGYVGVDIFFVLSGFLISSIIIKEINEGRFTFKAFFIRRIRRLCPMAFTLYFSVLLVFFFIYPSSFYNDLTEAGLSSILFFSNIYFWQQGGYFASEALQVNPFLHTWSLSIEEQFYFFFPVFLLLLFKITSSKIIRVVMISVVILMSLFLAIYFAPSKQSFAAFYLLPPRIYELAIGALIALLIYQHPQTKLRNTPWLQELGVLMILIAIFLFDKTTVFPSYNALLPVIGTAIFIYSNLKTGIVYRLLQNRVLVYIGVISYSLYLWHWPLILMKEWLFPKGSVIIDVIIIAVCFVLSHFSFKFIETPFRNHQYYPSKKVIKIFVLSFIILLLGMLLLNKVGNSVIVDPTGNINKAYLKAVEPEVNRSECTDVIRKIGKFHRCEWKSDTPNAKKIFIWGDSHGSALIPAFKALREQYTIVFSTNTGCIPIPNIARKISQQCIKINKLIFEHIKKNKYDLVVLSAAFNNYINGGFIKSEQTKNSDDAFSVNIIKLFTTLDKLDQKFIILTQSPLFSENIPKNYLRNKTLGIEQRSPEIPLSDYKKQYLSFYTLIPKKWRKNILNMDTLYCPHSKCISEKGGVLLYKDQHHISNYFTEFIGVYLKSYIDSIIV